jgi:hypothetical protein
MCDKLLAEFELESVRLGCVWWQPSRWLYLFKLLMTGEEQLLTQASLNAPGKKDGLNLPATNRNIKTELRSNGRTVPEGLPTIDGSLFDGILTADSEKNIQPTDFVSTAVNQAVGQNQIDIKSHGLWRGCLWQYCDASFQSRLFELAKNQLL